MPKNATDQQRADEAELIYDSNARDRSQNGQATGESPRAKAPKSPSSGRGVTSAVSKDLFSAIQAIARKEVERLAA